MHVCIQFNSEMYPILAIQGVLASGEEVSSPMLQSVQYWQSSEQGHGDSLGLLKVKVVSLTNLRSQLSSSVLVPIASMPQLHSVKSPTEQYPEKTHAMK